MKEMTEITLKIPNQHISGIAEQWGRPKIMTGPDGLAVYKTMKVDDKGNEVAEGEDGREVQVEQPNPMSEIEFIEAYLYAVLKGGALQYHSAAAQQAAIEELSKEIEDVFTQSDVVEDK